MFKLKNKDIRMTSTTFSTVSIVDFEQVIICWDMNMQK